MNTYVKCGYRPMFPTFFDKVSERAASNATELYFKPAANVHEDGSEFMIELALPGFEKEEISLKVDKNILTIVAGSEKKGNESENENESRHSWSEFGRSGKYRRSFLLPDTINVEDINAEYKNGILRVNLPKNETQPVKNKEITIA